MNVIKVIVTKPIFFERNRVYRIYHGGKPFKSLFDDGYGNLSKDKSDDDTHLYAKHYIEWGKWIREKTGDILGEE